MATIKKKPVLTPVEPSLEVSIKAITDNGRKFDTLKSLPGLEVFGYAVDIVEKNKIGEFAPTQSILIYIPGYSVSNLFND